RARVRSVGDVGEAEQLVDAAAERVRCGRVVRRVELVGDGEVPARLRHAADDPLEPRPHRAHDCFGSSRVAGDGAELEDLPVRLRQGVRRGEGYDLDLQVAALWSGGD